MAFSWDQDCFPSQKHMNVVKMSQIIKSVILKRTHALCVGDVRQDIGKLFSL